MNSDQDHPKCSKSRYIGTIDQIALPRVGVHLHSLDDRFAEDRLDDSVPCWRSWRKLSLDCGASRAWKACAVAGVSCPVYRLSPHTPCCWWPPFIIPRCKSNTRDRSSIDFPSKKYTRNDCTSIFQGLRWFT